MNAGEQLWAASRKAELSQEAPSKSSAEDIVFKEKECDGEDVLEPFKTILPSFQSFNLAALHVKSVFPESFASGRKHAPIFLTTHDLRI